MSWRRMNLGRARPIGPLALAALILSTALAQGASAEPRRTSAAPRGDASVWAAGWEASPEPPRAPFVNLTNQTVRQIARVGLGGLYVRIQLSNEFGDKPLTIGAAHVAVAAGAGAAIPPATAWCCSAMRSPTRSGRSRPICRWHGPPFR